MKKAVLLAVVVLVAATFLGRWMATDSGYVMVIRDNWEMDTTLGFAVLVGILAAVALVILTLLVNLLWNLAEPVRATRRFQHRTAHRRLRKGLLHLVDGELGKAERLLAAAGEKGDWPLLGWLLAAEAAHEKNDIEAQERYLDNAAGERRGDFVAGLMRARFALAENRVEDARQILKRLAESAPNNKRVLSLYADVLERQRQWEPLCELVPRLRKAFGEAAVARRERRAWLARLQQLGRKPGFDDAEGRVRELRQLWKNVPTALKQDPAMVARYAGFLAQLGDGRNALQLVRDQLGRDWDDRLPPVLEAIDAPPPDDLLAILEGWLAERPGNAAVLITAGRVALKARLWGKAQSFFEAAANSSQSATALAELSRLYLALGEQDKAAEVLARRVHDLNGELPALPLPDHGDQ